MEESHLDLKRYLEAAWRRKWLILIPFLLVAAVALFYSAAVPPVYMSETTILVEPQQVPEEYVQSTVTGSVQDRLNTISQQILSRTMLESVILELNLYADHRLKAPMEEVVERMRRNVEIRVESRAQSSRSAASAAAFRLAFYSGDPGVAQRVTQKLATLYIEENLRVRETMARGTREFLQKELQAIEVELKSTEEALRNFRQQYMGELPEQLDANLRSLDQLQQQRTALLNSLRSMEERQMQTERQLAETTRYLAGAGWNEEDLYRQLETKRQELVALRTRYTEQYPDVARLKREIKEIEQRVAGRGGSDGNLPAVDPLVNPAYARLENQISGIHAETEGLRNEMSRLDQRMTRIGLQVENTPRREQELITLMRDYDTIKANYNSMMARKINAEIAENLEARQKSEQFRILDPANYPEEPVRPNRMRILGLGLVLGLALGGGLAFGVEFLDRSLRSAEDVKASFSIPLIGVLPYLTTAAEARRRRNRLVAMGCLLGGLTIGGVVGLSLHLQEVSAFLKGLLKGVL